MIGMIVTAGVCAWGISCCSRSRYAALQVMLIVG